MSEKVCGIYTITNLVNFMYYLGRTKNYTRRTAEHLRQLRGDKHYNKHLQRSFNEYGERNFVIELIEKVEDPSLLEIIEQKYLDSLDYTRVYNMSKSSAGVILFGEDHPMFGKHHREESKQKTSQATKGEKNPMYGKKLSEESIRKMVEGHLKDFAFISPSGDNVNIRNLTKFCKENNLDVRAMQRVFHGEKRHHKGWHVSPSKLRNYSLCSPEGEIFHIKNIAEFCKGTYLDRRAMNTVALGKRKNYKGWTKPQTNEE